MIVDRATTGMGGAGSTRRPPGRVRRVRQWLAAVGVIAAAHLAVLTWMASQRAAPMPPSLVMDVRLGFGLPAGVRWAGMPGGQASGTDSAPMAAAPPDVAAEPASEAVPEPAPTSEALSASEAEPPPVDAAQAAGAGAGAEAAAAIEAATEAADVLAMVEAMTGVSAQGLDAADTGVNGPSGSPFVGAQAGTSGGCAITAQVQVAFQQRAELRAATAAIPRNDRSVANAVQLWNGEWTVARLRTGQDAITPVRDAIAELVRAAPQECQNAPVLGPVFFLAMEADAPPVVIVVGSGVWRWADTLAAPPARSGWWPFRRNPDKS